MGNCFNISDTNAKQYVPQITKGVVVKVYYGDTIAIVAKLPIIMSDYDRYDRFSVRLLGIDCAEIKGKTTNETVKKVRDAVSDKILNRNITLRNVSTEKYGRLLANIYLDGECINDWMLKNGYAVVYDGGKKERHVDWDMEERHVDWDMEERHVDWDMEERYVDWDME
jgi:endonuclease YncB( thermonuclease family)